jgi:hypothetical protein
VKVRAIASRPGVSDQPESSASADFRASVDSRSTMLVSRFQPVSILTPNAVLRIPAKTRRNPAGSPPPVTMTQM